MKLEVRGNKNYVGTITEINNLVVLEGCDNIQSSIIFGCSVIISKDVKIGDVGIYFPTETALSDGFLSTNNLYRDKELNRDKNKSGFFEKNKRIRAMKLRKYPSDGFWIPLSSLNIFGTEKDILNFSNLGQDFDHIDGLMICEKYIVKSKNQGAQNSKKDKKSLKVKRFNKLPDSSFRLHVDTPQLAKNIHLIQPDSLISVTGKLHGTSFVCGNVLCYRKLNWFEALCVRLRNWAGDTYKEKQMKAIKQIILKTIPKIQKYEYDLIYSSRKVIKNKYINPNTNHFYSEDIWGTVAQEFKPFIAKGMSIYGECVGFLKDGGYIQKGFDYGCDNGKHENYIYRITTTNEDGKVVEWTMLQVQQWCEANGLKAVPLHYYGKALNLFETEKMFKLGLSKDDRDIQEWQHVFLEQLQETYLEKQCSICKNSVPNEGICLRKETLDIDVWKLKSFLFRQIETRELDSGESNIEDSQEIDVV